MAGFTEGIKVFFGGDTSGLRASLNEANGLVDVFTKSVKKAGIDLGKGFGFGFLIFQAKQFFDAVINDAQKTRDAFEEMGKPVPAAVASVARLGDEVDRLKKGAMEVGTTMLSWVTRAGEGWGMMINRLRGVSAEQEKLFAQIEKDREAQEKKRDEALKNRGAKEKARTDEAKRDAEALARATEKRLDEEYEALVKVGAAQEKLDENRKKAAYEQLSLGEKINADEREAASLAKQIADYKKNGALSTNDQLKVIELENNLLEVNGRLVENRKNNTKETVIAEKDIVKELEKQKNALASIAGIRGGNQFNEASDESLAEVARRNRAQAQAVRGGLGGFGIGQDMEAARLEAEALNAERELDFRARIRQDAALGGKEAARRSFAGDPLKFDRVYDQIVKGQTVQEQSLQVNKDILEQLKTRGIVTVPMGGKR